MHATEFSFRWTEMYYISVTRCQKATRITIMHALITCIRAYLKRVGRKVRRK